MEMIMELENLTTRQREIYTQVEDYKKKNPDVSNMAALKALNLNPSTYSAAKKRVLGIEQLDLPIPTKRKYTRRPQMITIPIEEPPAQKIVAFVGDSHSVVASVNEFLKGK